MTTLHGPEDRGCWRYSRGDGDNAENLGFIRVDCASVVLLLCCRRRRRRRRRRRDVVELWCEAFSSRAQILDIKASPASGGGPSDIQISKLKLHPNETFSILVLMIFDVDSISAN